MRLAGERFANEVDSCGDIAPLVAAPHLKFNVVSGAEMTEIVGLQQHVAELGER